MEILNFGREREEQRKSLPRLNPQGSILRHSRAVQVRLRYAKLPATKMLDSFEWAHPSSIPKHLILNVFSLGFIEKKENFILIGPSGFGKTHIFLALSFSACQKEIKTLNPFILIEQSSPIKYNEIYRTSISILWPWRWDYLS